MRLLTPHYDASALVVRTDAGFGLLAPARPIALPEGDAWRTSLWALRRVVAARTPYAAKRWVGRVLDALPASVRKHVDPS